ncbi:MAG: hypothetical protein JO266_06910 [Acidobacteria bacterium]|nr:hypothetical protein [Acidobacteriota bacterium]
MASLTEQLELLRIVAAALEKHGRTNVEKPAAMAQLCKGGFEVAPRANPDWR